MNNSFAESISTSYLNILLSKTHRIDTSDIHRGEKGMCWDGSLIVFDDKGIPKNNDWDDPVFSDKASTIYYRPHMINGIIDVQKYKEMMKC